MSAKILMIAAFVVAPLAASAEVELSVYTGIQEAPHSKVTGTDPSNPVNTALAFTAGWEGKSNAMPPYYGARVTWWRNDSFGWGLEYTHDKVYADADTLATNGFNRLEFTDGLNIATLNANYRWKNRLMGGAVTPYVGGGLGFAFPHVDIESGGPHTWEYQLTGGAMRAFAGAKYQVNDRWAVIGEYQFTYSINDVDLDDGGTLKTNVVTNALNIGVSYSF